MNNSHYHFNETITVAYDNMATWITSIFQACGLSSQDARLVSDSLVDADCRGVYSHGTQRVSQYTNRIFHNCINLSGKPFIVVDAGCMAVVDGDNAMGQVVGKFSMNLAIEKAKQYGIGFVTARGSNHYGRCAYYTRMALEHDMIGISSTVGGGNLMAPWGGKESRVGNNPFSIAMPAGKRYPVVLDMAQSVVAKGKIEMALKTGSSIPEAWALDANGVPTTDPAKGSKGSVRPIADYKGSDLAIMVGYMSSMISGGAVGPTLKSVYNDLDCGLNKGQLFMAIDLGRLVDIDQYKARMDEQVDFIKSTPLADGYDDLYMPGELEYLHNDEQRTNGIVYAVEVIAEIRKISEKVGVAIPDWVC